jgi:hypothetical protein
VRHRPAAFTGDVQPEGFEKRFTKDEFVDLIAFLVNQQEGRAPQEGVKVETSP